MSANAVESFIVHGLSADLKLSGFATRAKDGGVETAVAVGLGDGDVVFEAIVIRCPESVNEAESFVAVRDVSDDDAQSEDVMDVVEFTVLVAHLLPDAVKVLEATFDGVFDTSSV